MHSHRFSYCPIPTFSITNYKILNLLAWEQQLAGSTGFRWRGVCRREVFWQDRSMKLRQSLKISSWYSLFIKAGFSFVKKKRYQVDCVSMGDKQVDVAPLVDVFSYGSEDKVAGLKDHVSIIADEMGRNAFSTCTCFHCWRCFPWALVHAFACFFISNLLYVIEHIRLYQFFIC
jgi:hypothetical protein